MRESADNACGLLQERLGMIVMACRAAGRARACLLSTRDRDHAIGIVKNTAEQAEIPLYNFTVAARRLYRRADRRWETLGKGPNDAYTLLDEAHRLNGGGIVVLEDCAAFLRDEGGDQRVRMLLAQMLSSETNIEGLVLVFVEPPEAGDRLPSILRDQFVRLDIPYPRIEELEALTRHEMALIVNRTGGEMPVQEIKQHAQRLASELVGLTRSAARDSLWDALATNPGDCDGAHERLSARKSEQLSRELAMNILDTASAEEPIGLENLVQYLQVTRHKMRLRGPARARGVLLIGPPGTGKTMLARAIGRLVDLPVVEFRISSMMNSLLGETERRFAQAFQTLAAMSPNVVFIDEIEKAFGDSSERDGGTMMRCTGALLSWLSDNPYPNFIVATSNSLRRMGEIGLTMTRSERFDAAFFVDVPSESARRGMLEIWLKGRIENPETLSTLAAITDKFSGADLRSVVKQAIACAEHAGLPLKAEGIKAQIERKRERVLALYDEFRELRNWGRQYCDPAADD